jgi:hypothetical protein
MELETFSATALSSSSTGELINLWDCKFTYASIALAVEYTALVLVELWYLVRLFTTYPQFSKRRPQKLFLWLTFLNAAGRISYFVAYPIIGFDGSQCCEHASMRCHCLLTVCWLACRSFVCRAKGESTPVLPDSCRLPAGRFLSHGLLHQRE